MTKRIVVVSAGLSVPSSTKLLADKLGDAVERAVGARGQEVDVQHVELRPLAHALADHLLTGFPTGDLAGALEQVRHADALVVVTPVFSASYSGLFKTFFDVLEPGTLDGKPVVIAATAGTAGTAWCSTTRSGRCSPTCVPWSSRPASSPPARTSVRAMTAVWTSASSVRPGSSPPCSAPARAPRLPRRSAARSRTSSRRRRPSSSCSARRAGTPSADPAATVTVMVS